MLTPNLYISLESWFGLLDRVDPYKNEHSFVCQASIARLESYQTLTPEEYKKFDSWNNCCHKLSLKESFQRRREFLRILRNMG